MLISIIAVGVCVTLPPTESAPLVHLHPSSLDKSWSLKGNPSLHSPELCEKRYLGVLFTGVMLSNGAGLLLSASVWMQVAAMGGFKASVIIKHMQAAVRRACARTSHNHVPSERWVRFIAHKLPLHRNKVLVLLHGWLRTNAYSAGGGYTSWHVPHPDSTAHTSMCGSWRHDADGLLHSG